MARPEARRRCRDTTDTRARAPPPRRAGRRTSRDSRGTTPAPSRLRARASPSPRPAWREPSVRFEKCRRPISRRRHPRKSRRAASSSPFRHSFSPPSAQPDRAMASTGLGLATFPSSARRASGALASTPPRAPLTARRASPRDIRLEWRRSWTCLSSSAASSQPRALAPADQRAATLRRAHRGRVARPARRGPPPRLSAPPTPAAPHLVRFLRERLGRNLYVGDHDPSRGGYAAGTGTGGRLTPGGDLLVALGPERPDGGAWTGSDLARVRSHLEAT